MVNLLDVLRRCDVDQTQITELLEAGFTPFEIIDSGVKQVLPRMSFYIDTRRDLKTVYDELKARRLPIVKSNLIKVVKELGIRKTFNYSTMHSFLYAYSDLIEIYHSEIGYK